MFDRDEKGDAELRFILREIIEQLTRIADALEEIAAPPQPLVAVKIVGVLGKPIDQ